MIIGDVAVLPERVKRELIRGENAQAEFAIRAQTALKEAMDGMGPCRHIEGLGIKRATIHPELAARIRVKFRRNDGFDPLHDRDFIKALLRDNPFLRVQTIPAKLTLRVNGLRKPDTGNRIEGEDSRRPEEGQNEAGAGQHSARLQSADRSRRGEPTTPLDQIDVPVIKQTAGAALVLP